MGGLSRRRGIGDLDSDEMLGLLLGNAIFYGLCPDLVLLVAAIVANQVLALALYTTEIVRQSVVNVL